MATPEPESILVPVQLDAFILNPAVCGDGDKEARIIPITQPNYTFLRLRDYLLQSDVQNHADLHSTAPAALNSRLTDLGAVDGGTTFHRHRHGIYVHWTLPRFYRSGLLSSDAAPETRNRDERRKRGMETSGPLKDPHASTGSDARDSDKKSSNSPEFVSPPTRWLVIRRIHDLENIQPVDARGHVKELQAWVVESDHLWGLDEIPDDLEHDLQTEMAPFVVGTSDTSTDDETANVNIELQAEVFIGRKTPLEDWTGLEGENATFADISLLRSSNQLFADFQMHNSNVFSLIDNFQYGTSKDPKYLDYAEASYYVLGWHRKEEIDPLWRSGLHFTHRESLDTLFMTLNANDDWMTHDEQLRILCHGAMYDVVWDHSKKPKQVPADTFASRLRDLKLPAISVGTSPMDALVSYCTSRKSTGGNSDEIRRVEEDILALYSLLHARDDGVEAQREAKDEIYNWNFTRSSGGTRYHISSDVDGENESSTKKSLDLEDEVTKRLSNLNDTQALLDATNRTLQQRRWDMFSQWWHYVSDVSNKGDDHGLQQLIDRKFKYAVDPVARDIKKLDEVVSKLETDVQNQLSGKDEHGTLEPVHWLKDAKAGTSPFFYRSCDPTVLLGGIESGWACDFMDRVQVRRKSQLLGSEDSLTTSFSGLADLTDQKLPVEFRDTVRSLLSEFSKLRTDTIESGSEADGKECRPQFHDKIGSGRWRDRWGDRQPWFPLYAEWEVEYTEIPFHEWKLGEQTARLSAGKIIRYGVKSDRPLWEKLKDTRDVRVLSGRVLILPQPTFSLAAKVKQLFDVTPGDTIKELLTKARSAAHHPPEGDTTTAEDLEESLLQDIKKLAYLSAPLSGFTEGLLTLNLGSHIKPENKQVIDGKDVFTPITSATFHDAGLTADNLGQIRGNSAFTPYASMVRFLDDKHCPFKPVTHGQFRFTKFNVIDKFGQALAAIDPQPRIQAPDPVYPCISDFYEPQLVKVGGADCANTVIRGDPKSCSYIQLPPQINQNVRLNAEFVVPSGDAIAGVDASQAAPWRPAAEWENPVWGWLICNFADHGIQFFLPDGVFYREVRFGGPIGTQVEPKWVPFLPDKTAETSTVATKQLDALVTALQNPTYLKCFWDMITEAQDNLPAAPAAYAQFLNSVIGRPLALVNMGWSLELDRRPLRNEASNAATQDPKMTLTEDYDFQVKLGDKDSEYDGLVGYFNMHDDTKPAELDMAAINTFFAPAKPDEGSPLSLITTTSYPTFKPFWQPTLVLGEPYSAATYANLRNKKLSVFGAILDPFTPVHAYSSFLPPRALHLPSWIWQNAFNNMTTFFHAGPLCLVRDVPGVYNPDQPLDSTTWRLPPKGELALPSLGAGDWSWLQPYDDPSTHTEAAPRYNPFGIQKTGDIRRPGFQKGPYTAVEGFLQLRNPVMTESPKKNTSATR
ncbi:hypothetical protein GGR57DRAFT_74780 [Xylariaceae sp. FL1272]|nr:hypothetical protein GGR57DRAFT_74780 [Xylariaceae sp. FL1272]